MKAWIREIKAHKPGHLGPDGEVLSWRPMVIELQVEAPKDQEEAAAQLKQARELAYPRNRGAMVCAPPALSLAKFVAWPTCAECETDVRLVKIDDTEFMAECHLCAAASSAPDPTAALEEFARELGQKEDR